MKNIIILLVMCFISVPAHAGVYVASTAGAIAATSAARNSSINAAEQSGVSSFGEIKAVCRCQENVTGCIQFSGWKVAPEKTFHQVAVECSGHDDAKVIGINTYQNEIYVTW